MKYILTTLCLMALTCVGKEPQEIRLAAEGVPQAEIVVAKEAHPAMAYAAEELQKWVKAISGAELPIVAEPSGKTATDIILCLNPEVYKGDLAAIGETDGYAVRYADKKLYIFGTRPKGVLNGVFRMLFKNTDIIWARPNEEFGTSFSKNPNLSLTQFNYRDVPTFILRGWQMGSGRPGPNLTWQMRNAQNWTAGTMNRAKALEKYDNILEYGGGHNLCGLYIQEKKYYDKHPEFYPLIDGKRMRPSERRESCQLCFTNKEMQAAFIAEIDARYKANPTYDTYRIMIEDNYNLCECPECMKPIQLPDGTVVKPDDKAFRSTQFFLWLNPIAKHIKENYHKNVLCFAYFFTEIPPKCSVEDNVSLSFCPIYKNSKLTVLEPGNELTFNKLDGWLKITPNITWREYYGLCQAFPRPIDIIASADWRYCNSRGVTRTYSEMYPDGEKDAAVQSWDINSMYFWVLSNLAWDPNVSHLELRDVFLKRVYGAAADDVKRFYSIIEESWFKLPGSSKWNDKIRANWLAHVVKPGLTDQCAAALNAAISHCDKENGRKMLARMKAVFEANTKDIKIEKMSSLQVSKAPEFDPQFASGDWTRTQMSDAFLTDGNLKMTCSTEVRILHDDTNFYVGMLCRNPNMAELRKQMKPEKAPRNKWVAGEKAELFLTGLKDGQIASYQIVVSPKGEIFDSCNVDTSWNGDFDVKIDVRDDGWSLLYVIPYKILGYSGRPDKVSTSFLRYAADAKGSTTVGFWNGNAPHSLAGYTELIMK